MDNQIKIDIFFKYQSISRGWFITGSANGGGLYTDLCSKREIENTLDKINKRIEILQLQCSEVIIEITLKGILEEENINQNFNTFTELILFLESRKILSDQISDKELQVVPKGKCYLSNPQIKRQSEQKGPTCWYYTMNYLRDRYGKESNHPNREIEKIFSECRKRISELDEIESIFKDEKMNSRKYVEGFIYDTEQYIGKNKQNLPILEINRYNIQLEFIKKLRSDYLEQSNKKSFREFYTLMQTKQLITITQETLQKLQLDPEKTLDAYLTRINCPKIASQLTLEEKEISYHNALILTVAKMYELGCSTWSPDQGMAGLNDELSKGPMAFSGKFGASNYRYRPHPLKEICDKRAVYAWKPGEYNPDNPLGQGHYILVIKAKIENNKNYIYYLDPSDASDPSEVGRVYKISYERFLSGLADVCGRYNKKSFKSLGPFAFHKKQSAEQPCETKKTYCSRYGLFAVAVTGAAVLAGAELLRESYLK